MAVNGKMRRAANTTQEGVRLNLTNSSDKKGCSSKRKHNIFLDLGRSRQIQNRK